MIGAAFGDTCRHRANTNLGHQLDRNTRLRVDAFQIANELRQIFDGIDIVMRRRRDQSYAGRRMAHAGDIFVHFRAGQLSALAGFGSLRHLDLNIVRVDEVFRRHAEASRCHLFDGRARGVAVGKRFETFWLFPTLAGVGTRADAVHRNREIGVRLARDRAEAHRSRCEALDDLDSRFDLVERDCVFGNLELHQPAQGQKPLALFVDRAGKQLIFGQIVAAHGVLQTRHRFRRPGMVFAAQAESIVAADIQHVAIDRIRSICVAVSRDALLGNFLQADALNRRCRTGEIFFDKLGGQPHGVENLCAAIGLIG